MKSGHCQEKIFRRFRWRSGTRQRRSRHLLQLDDGPRRDSRETPRPVSLASSTLGQNHSPAEFPPDICVRQNSVVAPPRPLPSRCKFAVPQSHGVRNVSRLLRLVDCRSHQASSLSASHRRTTGSSEGRSAPHHILGNRQRSRARALQRRRKRCRADPRAPLS